MRLPVSRIFHENRRLAIPVIAALVLNLLALVLVIYPLQARVESTRVRAQTAAQALQVAARDEAAARSAVEGRTRTETALKAFYSEILPSTMAQARETTFLRLAQIAEAHNLQQTGRSSDVEVDKTSGMARMRIVTSLHGDYEDIRRFIHQLESGDAFIVLDSVSLRQGVEAGSPLTLDLALSTYYRATRTDGA